MRETIQFIRTAKLCVFCINEFPQNHLLFTRESVSRFRVGSQGRRRPHFIISEFVIILNSRK